MWIWKYGGNELFMDVGEPIRFRIVRESFKDASPTPAHRRRPSSSTPTSLPSAPTAPTEAGTGGVAGEEGGVGSFSNADKIAPYSLTVSYSRKKGGIVSVCVWGIGWCYCPLRKSLLIVRDDPFSSISLSSFFFSFWGPSIVYVGGWVCMGDWMVE